MEVNSFLAKIQILAASSKSVAKISRERRTKGKQKIVNVLKSPPPPQSKKVRTTTSALSSFSLQQRTRI